MVDPRNQKQPPKLPETRPPARGNRATAWACVVGNLVLPGLGTFVARHRLAGVLQLIVSQAGFLLMLVWAISYASIWIRQGRFPEDPGPLYFLGIVGMLLFLLAWIWSLASSIEIVWQLRRERGLATESERRAQLDG